VSLRGAADRGGFSVDQGAQLFGSFIDLVDRVALACGGCDLGYE
jgi:hypothetical protein